MRPTVAVKRNCRLFLNHKTKMFGQITEMCTGPDPLTCVVYFRFCRVADTFHALSLCCAEKYMNVLHQMTRKLLNNVSFMPRQIMQSSYRCLPVSASELPHHFESHYCAVSIALFSMTTCLIIHLCLQSI